MFTCIFYISLFSNVYLRHVDHIFNCLDWNLIKDEWNIKNMTASTSTPYYQSQFVVVVVVNSIRKWCHEKSYDSSAAHTLHLRPFSRFSHMRYTAFFQFTFYILKYFVFLSGVCFFLSVSLFETSVVFLVQHSECTY